MTMTLWVGCTLFLPMPFYARIEPGETKSLGGSDGESGEDRYVREWAQAGILMGMAHPPKICKRARASTRRFSAGTASRRTSHRGTSVPYEASPALEYEAPLPNTRRWGPLHLRPANPSNAGPSPALVACNHGDPGVTLAGRSGAGRRIHQPQARHGAHRAAE